MAFPNTSPIFSVLNMLVAFLFVASNVCAQTQSDNLFLKDIKLNCNRNCDSHFTGKECWSQTFEYFTNNLMQSLVQYSHVEKQLKTNIERSKLHDTLSKTYQDYKSDETIQSFIKDLVTQFDTIFNETIQKLRDAKTSPIAKEIKCPQKCNTDSLTVWISLFGVLIGLTLTSIVFVAAYVIFTKLQQKKYDKKLVTGAAAAPITSQLNSLLNRLSSLLNRL